MNDSKTATRSIELEVTVNAPVEVVWNALADPEKLANWFPLRASGGSGKGATVSISWDPSTEWTTTIDEWVPNKHLRWVDPPAAEGLPPSAIDFRLESKGGRTIVRLVHSGFGASADWDDMYDATVGGWTYFLYNLQHYLEHHPNVSRNMVWTRRPTTKSPSEIWERLLGDDGFGIQPGPDAIASGQSYRIDSLGEPVTGTVRMFNAPKHFAGTADSLEDGLLFVECEPGSDKRHVGIWLSTYGLTDDRVGGLQTRLNAIADRVFGTQASS